MSSWLIKYSKGHFVKSSRAMKSALILFSTAMVSTAVAAPGVTHEGKTGEYFFAGSVMQCSPASTGKDPECCIADGSESGAAMSQCTASGRALAWLAQHHGLTVYLGEVCAQGVKTCQTPVAVYCAFSDTVTYRIQTEGRKQLGVGFGTAASPDCGGLTSEQMKKIDLNKITFGDQPYQSIM